MADHDTHDHTGIPGVGGGIAATIVDAKGDLIVGTAADTVARLAVGANDTIPMADSGQSTGIKWVASQTPSTQAFSDAAAEGTADTYARGDHKHGMMANPGGGGDLASGKVERTNIGSNRTIASGTWADIDGTNLSITMTTGAHRVLLMLSGVADCDTANKVAAFGWSVDGTAKYDDEGWVYHADPIGGEYFNVQNMWVTDVLSAGSHTFKPRWVRLSAAGTFSLHQSSASERIVFSAVELPVA